MYKNLLFLMLLLPLSVFADEHAKYSTLVQSPLGSSGGLSAFLNDVYLIVISATALFAVVKIIIAGVKYMLADIPGSKQDAKNDIRTALFGLIIIVSAVLILRTINPNLTTFSLKFQKPEQRVPEAVTLLDNVEDIPFADCVRVKEEETPQRHVLAIDVSSCDDVEERAAQLALLESTCANEGGVMDTSQGESSGRYACAVQVYYERFDISGYDDGVGGTYVNLGDLKKEPYSQYLTNDGNLIELNARGYCEEKYRGQSQDTLQQCVDNVSDAFLNDDDIYSFGGGNAYCENNGGRPESDEESDILRCRLPKEAFSYEEAIAYAREHQPHFLDRNVITGEILNEEEFGLLCSLKFPTGNPQLIDMHVNSREGAADTVCVKYN